MGLDVARMQRLLDSGLELASELALDTLLQRAVELAAELTAARYAALGILGDDGLADFLTTGISDDERAAIGTLPRGRGVLGALITDATPLRLHELAADPRSSGFPANHPAMRSFLGAPVRARGRVFGNFYLTEKHGGGDFTDEDEATLVILATQVGAAIDNARLYAEARLLDRSLAALREAGQAIRDGGDPRTVLELVAGQARELCDARLATILLPTRPGNELTIDVAAGRHAEELVGVVVPVDRSLAGQVFREGSTLRLAAASRDERGFGPMVQLGEFGPAIFVPLSAGGTAFGVLTVSRPLGSAPFADADVLLMETFAGQAALALEYGRAMRDLQRLALAEDRDRIARELHDGVIQALFATGLTLQSTAGVVGDALAADRIQRAVGEIDAVIRDLRGYIFGLRPGVLTRAGLADALEELGRESQQRTGVIVVVHIDDSVLPEVDEAAEADLIQVAREALSNVGRHAGATTCRLSLHRSDGAVVLEIDDDGEGFDQHRISPGMGLGNLHRRAERLGGRLDLESVLGQGTLVRLTLPPAQGGERALRRD